MEKKSILIKILGKSWSNEEKYLIIVMNQNYWVIRVVLKNNNLSKETVLKGSG